MTAGDGTPHPELPIADMHDEILQRSGYFIEGGQALDLYGGGVTPYGANCVVRHW